jgi:hypothetical protein
MRYLAYGTSRRVALQRMTVAKWLGTAADSLRPGRSMSTGVRALERTIGIHVTNGAQWLTGR